MKNKGTFRYVVFFFTAFFLMMTDICPAQEYEVLHSGVSIGTTQRHEWHPWVEYNSVDDEFLVIWRSSGKLRDDCEPGDEYECSYSFQGIMGQRISPKGDLLGATIIISPEEGPNDNVSWKSMPRHAYNPLRNEYIITYTANTNPSDTMHDNEINIVRLEANGTISGGPNTLYPTIYNASHPDVAFNPLRREWLVVYNDKYIFRPEDDFDNPGFILDENGNAISGPFIIGLPIGSNFAPCVDYNPTDDTYLLAWEDWRYGPPEEPWFFRPAEIYGALLYNDGAMLDPEIPVIDDFDLPDTGTQLMPCITYNPDRNEFLVVWGDTSPSFDGGGVLGRIIMSDGTPKGPDFIIANTIGTQGAPKSAYVTKNQSYFVVWQDSRDFPFDPDDPWASENDIYAKWLNTDGLPIGDDTPIYIGEGNQGMPSVAYSPAADRFLIAWRDEHAPGDYEPVGPGAMMSPEINADVRGAIYGAPGPCAAKEIYGEHSKEVELMRYVRDNILKSTAEGQELIKLYYQLSPAIVKAMKENKEIKEQVRELIDGLLPLIR